VGKTARTAQVDKIKNNGNDRGKKVEVGRGDQKTTGLFLSGAE